MAVQGENKETEKNIGNTASNHQADSGSQPEPVVLLNAMSYGAERSPKVRKPYTISKQREKWTDEEHQRFLEALKLYGRGWRQIQEHVGTKTAVQIRSHAQKFFSKVVRESNGVEESLANPIEIPPPRPKKKPLHPYPRKSLESLKVNLIPKQALQSPSPNLAVGDKEIQSPTSIFTAFGSEEMGSACSEQSNICVSPTSFTSDVHSHSLSPVQKECDNVSSDSVGEEAKGSLSFLNISTNLTLGHFLSTELTSALENNESVKEEFAIGSSVRRIKLFGSTVLVTDNKRPSSQTSPTSKIDLDHNTHYEKLHQISPNNQFGTWNFVPFVAPIDMEGYEHKNDDCTQESGSNASLPLWSLCHGLPYYNTACLNPLSDERIKEERSCSDSNPGSLTKVEDEEKNVEAVVSRRQEAHNTDSEKKSTKGFVPYKRCLANRETGSCLIVSEERERQKSRVCT